MLPALSVVHTVIRLCKPQICPFKFKKPQAMESYDCYFKKCNVMTSIPSSFTKYTNLAVSSPMGIVRGSEKILIS